jgi:hypothetical protein
MNRPEKPEIMISKVLTWNKNHSVGTLVTVVKDDGEIIETETVSEAWMLGASGDYLGHTPVIKLKDITGCYLLDRVSPR